jgi:hypothetical protein
MSHPGQLHCTLRALTFFNIQGGSATGLRQQPMPKHVVLADTVKDTHSKFSRIKCVFWWMDA